MRCVLAFYFNAEDERIKERMSFKSAKKKLRFMKKATNKVMIVLTFFKKRIFFGAHRLPATCKLCSILFSYELRLLNSLQVAGRR